jgi:hypothetical protein
MTMRFILWAKQWTQVTKGATFSLNYRFTIDLWPWNTLLSSHLMLTSLPTSSSNFNPPYSTKHFNIKEKMLSDVVDIPTICIKKEWNPFPLLNHIHVDKESLGIIDCCNFIDKNNNERSKNKSCFGGIQENVMHNFYHPPTIPINLMFLRNRFNL